VEEFGHPIYGLSGPAARDGRIGSHGGLPCDSVGLTYELEGGRVTVTTSRRPMGGSRQLLTTLLLACTPEKVVFPLEFMFTERNVRIPIAGTVTQFRVVACSTGHWAAAGGLKKRHLQLAGWPPVSPEELELTPVALDFSGHLVPAPG
jgi:hypothetical protein